MARRKVTGPVVVADITSATSWIKSTTRRPSLASVLSICDHHSGKNPVRPKGLFRSRLPNVLALTFEDDNYASDVGPTPEDVSRILAWGRRYHEHFNNPAFDKRVLIHCWAGRCRSSAAAFMCFAQALGPGQEAEAARATIEACENDPLPNVLMVQYADEQLGLGGRLVHALDLFTPMRLSNEDQRS